MQNERSTLPIGGEHAGHFRTRYSCAKYPSIREREPKRASCVGRDSHGPGEHTGRERVELAAYARAVFREREADGRGTAGADGSLPCSCQLLNGGRRFLRSGSSSPGRPHETCIERARELHNRTMERDRSTIGGDASASHALGRRRRTDSLNDEDYPFERHPGGDIDYRNQRCKSEHCHTTQRIERTTDIGHQPNNYSALQVLPREGELLLLRGREASL